MRDVKGEYSITVIGDEPHLAYNRVGLSTFFEHRVVENLYLNPKEWVRSLDPLRVGPLLTSHAVLILRQRIIQLPARHPGDRDPS